MDFKLTDVALHLKVQDNLDRLRQAFPFIQPNWNEGPWIAGGCLRRLIMGQDPLGSDIDVFCAHQDQAQELIGRLKRDYLVTWEAKGQNHTTLIIDVGELKFKFQIVTVDYYSDPWSLIDSFDYTICQLVTDGEQLGAGGYTMLDIGAKRLAIHRVTYAIPTMRRMIKYTKQGFYACPGMMDDFLRKVVENPGTIDSKVVYFD